MLMRLLTNVSALDLSGWKSVVGEFAPSIIESNAIGSNGVRVFELFIQGNLSNGGDSGSPEMDMLNRYPIRKPKIRDPQCVTARIRFTVDSNDESANARKTIERCANSKTAESIKTFTTLWAEHLLSADTNPVAFRVSASDFVTR